MNILFGISRMSCSDVVSVYRLINKVGDSGKRRARPAHAPINYIWQTQLYKANLGKKIPKGT